MVHLMTDDLADLEAKQGSIIETPETDPNQGLEENLGDVTGEKTAEETAEGTEMEDNSAGTDVTPMPALETNAAKAVQDDHPGEETEGQRRVEDAQEAETPGMETRRVLQMR